MGRILKFIAILIPIIIVLLGSGAWLVAATQFTARSYPVGSIPTDLDGFPVSFTSSSGSRIAGWLFPGTRNAGIVLMHGKDGDRRSMLGRARFLNAAGYSTLVFDFQANGESPGEHMTYGFLESLDAHAAVDFLQTELGLRKVGIIGFSLGGAAALLGPRGPLQVDAMVLEAVYPTVAEAIANRIRMRLGFYSGWLYRVITWQLKFRLGVDPRDLRPIDRIGASKTPVFVIAGENDIHTTLAESKRLFAAAMDPKCLWIVSLAQHEDFHEHSPAAYRRRVLAFFSKHMKEN